MRLWRLKARDTPWTREAMPPTDALARLPRQVNDIHLVRCEDQFEGDGGAVVNVHGFELIVDGQYVHRDRWPDLEAEGIYVFHIAGTSHHQSDANSPSFSAGKLIHLERDPGNAYDANACKVLSETGRQAGFVPAELAARLAPELDGLGVIRAQGVVIRTYSVDHARHGIEVIVPTHTISIDVDA